MANKSLKHSAPGRGLVFTVFLVVVGLWIASLFAIPWAARKHYGLATCEDRQAVAAKARNTEFSMEECRTGSGAVAGTFGDSFGAINALFSGLALAGVVLALFFHSEGAKRVAKPFLVPKMRRGTGDARVTVGEPSRTGGNVQLPFLLEVPLQNASAHPALNVVVRITVANVTATDEYVADVPLAAEDVASCSLKLSIVGNQASGFVEAVCGAGVNAQLRVEYDSVEGVKWFSQVSYLLRASANRPEDQSLLRDAIEGTSVASNLWAVDATVDLEFSTISGSWSYGEV